MYCGDLCGDGICGPGDSTYISDDLEDCFNCPVDCSICPVCDDGIVTPPEECDPIGSTQPCTLSLVLPLHCGFGATTTAVQGIETCDANCEWISCSSDISNSSESCGPTDPIMNDYTCCNIFDCVPDTCGCCGRVWGSEEPTDYTTVQTMSPCPISHPIDQSCKLNQSDFNDRNWIITTEHTTAYFECWR